MKYKIKITWEHTCTIYKKDLEQFDVESIGMELMSLDMCDYDKFKVKAVRKK
jgi:hypothetical protein